MWGEGGVWEVWEVWGKKARGKRNQPLTPPRRGRQEEPTPNPSQEGKAIGNREDDETKGLFRGVIRKQHSVL
ncbi:hypothetical protein BJP37_29640 [Moorena bouillonii PNG]|uniref:Uncharacterized protein n=1 Tax=Moorena bouillonii PNG TaxID=568701 RepID=A0A1U7N9G6_9CYAN|nr:hypothetical protein BJP37_29640 [Moorena bouillonii PNG]